VTLNCLKSFYNVKHALKKPGLQSHPEAGIYKKYCVTNSGCTKKKFRTYVIKLDIAPKSFPPGQYLLVSASNNMLYYLSQ
jgi:hypothetical protein